MERSTDLDGLRAAARQSGERWLEFLRVPALSAGLYRLRRGDSDTQTPHGEDEIYYVLAGRARLLVEEREHEVAPGGLLFVPARAEHRFFDISEDLELLVVFAPAEGSRG